MSLLLLLSGAGTSATQVNADLSIDAPIRNAVGASLAIDAPIHQLADGDLAFDAAIQNNVTTQAGSELGIDYQINSPAVGASLSFTYKINKATKRQVRGADLRLKWQVDHNKKVGANLFLDAQVGAPTAVGADLTIDAQVQNVIFPGADLPIDYSVGSLEYSAAGADLSLDATLRQLAGSELGLDVPVRNLVGAEREIDAAIRNVVQSELGLDAAIRNRVHGDLRIDAPVGIQPTVVEPDIVIIRTPRHRRPVSADLGIASPIRALAGSVLILDAPVAQTVRRELRIDAPIVDFYDQNAAILLAEIDDDLTIAV